MQIIGYLVRQADYFGYRIWSGPRLELVLLRKEANNHSGLWTATLPIMKFPKVRHNPTPKVFIASPCGISWEQMDGDDCVRNCRKCKSPIYNLPLNDRGRIARIISSTEGKLPSCLYYRRDGKLMSSDCPIGKKQLRDRTTAAAALFLAMWPADVPVAAQDAFEQPSIKQGTKKSNSFNELATCGTIGPASSDSTVIKGVNTCSTRELTPLNRAAYFMDDLYNWILKAIGEHPLLATTIVACAAGLLAAIAIKCVRKVAAGSRKRREGE
jgi:hypothetical protein